MTKAQKAERDEAVAQLREWFPPGSTAYTILRHCSRSGMQRTIGVLATLGGGDFRHPNYAASKALGWTLDPKREGVKVSGCGMDMGFHLAYALSATLYPDGFGCVGEECPSNDHSNGDRDYTPHGLFDENGLPENRTPESGEVKDGCRNHWHHDGGYALRQRWL